MLSTLKCPICRSFVMPKVNRGLNVSCEDCKYLIHPVSQEEIEALKIPVHDVIKKKESGENFLLLDVRGKDEYETTHINFAKLIPLNELPKSLAQLPKDKEIVCHCHHGGRSMTAARFLSQHGFKAKSMDGGIDAWSLLVDSSVRRY